LGNDFEDQKKGRGRVVSAQGAESVIGKGSGCDPKSRALGKLEGTTGSCLSGKGKGKRYCATQRGGPQGKTHKWRERKEGIDR